MDAEAESLLQEFIAESREHLDLAEKKLLALEGTADAETVNELFRAIHTVKGAAGFFKLAKLGALAHVAESLLSKVRDGTIVVDKPLVDILLESVDQLLGMLGRDDLGERVDTRDLFGRLQNFVATATRSTSPSTPPAPSRGDAPGVAAEGGGARPRRGDVGYLPQRWQELPARIVENEGLSRIRRTRLERARGPPPRLTRHALRPADGQKREGDAAVGPTP